jgi:hypothetical protein
MPPDALGRRLRGTGDETASNAVSYFSPRPYRHRVNRAVLKNLHDRVAGQARWSAGGHLQAGRHHDADMWWKGHSGDQRLGDDVPAAVCSEASSIWR